MRKELRPVHDLISCDLCQRTILKGERIETFVGGGEHQRVCELCSMRALRSGWQRQAELERRAPDRERQEPRRSLWSRAVTWAEGQGLWGTPPPDDDETAAPEPRPDQSPEPAPEPGPARADTPGPGPRATRFAGPAAEQSLGDPARSSSNAPDQASSDPDAGRAEVLPEHLSSARDRAEQRRRARRLEEEWEGEQAVDGGEGPDAASMARRPARVPTGAGLRDLIAGRRREPREVSAVPTSRWGKIERALELFNESEHRRTIAGIGRALGEPWVSAAPREEGATVREVGIVVAWELSWYRYRVDLDDADQAVLLLDRGNELDDLEEPLRHWNVGANGEGRLALAVEAVS